MVVPGLFYCARPGSLPPIPATKSSPLLLALTIGATFSRSLMTAEAMARTASQRAASR